jgi:hypothetical protein
MAELTWDEKNKLALARRAEKDYQFWATGGLNKPKHDTGGDGGPRRGGKAKYTMSKVFDDSGETLTETNLDEDGSETKVIKKTPSTLLEDQTFLSDNMDLNFNDTSIATPPEPDLIEQQRLGKLYQEQRELAGVRDLGVRFGDEPYNLSPVIGADGRYLLNSEYYGEPADHWESAPINKEVVLNEDTGEFEVHSESDPVVNDTGLLWQSDNDIYLAQDKIRQDYDERDLMDIRNHHPDLFVQMMNEGSFVSRPDPHPHAGEGFIENEVGEIVPIEVVASELEENLDGDGDGKNDKANEKLKYDSINTLAKEDPEKIKVLNRFASWMEDENVSDAESLRAAEDYLENLRNEPTVHDRVKKAMAIAFAAMLFGDDLTTAMNTGFGVVDDDYIAEATAEAAEAAANAELQKTLAKERRAAIEWDRQKQISFALDMKKEKYKNGVEAAKEKEKEIKARNTNNYDWMKNGAETFWKGLNEDQRKQFRGTPNFLHEYNRALQFVKNAQPDVVWDFKNNNDQAVAFNTQFKKWIQDNISGVYGKNNKPPSFYNYMQDAFIKTKMEEDSPLAMIDTNPSVADLQDLGYNIDKIDWAAGMEQTTDAYNKIVNWSKDYNERAVLELLAKDYYDWRDSEAAAGTDGWSDMVERANKNGIGGFIWYVNNHADLNSAIGTIYDPDAAELSFEERADYAVTWLEKKGIIVVPKK